MSFQNAIALRYFPATGFNPHASSTATSLPDVFFFV